MHKIKFLVGAFGVFAVLLGAVAMAQTSSSPSATIISPLPQNVPQGKFFLEKGRVAGWAPGSLTVQMASNEPCTTNTAVDGSIRKTEKGCFGDKTISFDTSNILLLGPSDQIISPALPLKLGQTAIVYYMRSGDNSNFYLVKYFGPVEFESDKQPMLCTTDVKQCPDGRWVSRGGPKCEFAACNPSDVPIINNTGEKPSVGSVGRSICISVTKDGTARQVCKNIPPGILKKGVQSEQVKQLQERLQKEGFLPADATTGFFGNMTFQAVKEFQKTKGLPSTGFVGDMTLEKLEAEND